MPKFGRRAAKKGSVFERRQPTELVEHVVIFHFTGCGHCVCPTYDFTTGALAPLRSSRRAMSSLSRAQSQALGVLRTLLRHARTTSANCPVAIAAAASHAAKGADTLTLPVPAAGAAGGASSAAAAATAASPHDRLSGWSAYIMAQYRANAALSKRGDVKSARDAARDLAEYLAAVAGQAALTEAYRGADADSTDQRRNVARFVGLDMPQVPEGAQVGPLAERYTAAAAGKYGSTLAARLGVDGVGGSSAGSGSGSGSGEGAGGGLPPGTRLTGIDAIKAQYYGVASLSPTLQAAQAATAAASGGGRGGAVVPPPAMDAAAAAAAKAAAAAAYAERVKAKAAAKAASAGAAGGTA
jgi:hypothetical protein